MFLIIGFIFLICGLIELGAWLVYGSLMQLGIGIAGLGGFYVMIWWESKRGLKRIR